MTSFRAAVLNQAELRHPGLPQDPFKGITARPARPPARAPKGYPQPHPGGRGQHRAGAAAPSPRDGDNAPNKRQTPHHSNQPQQPEAPFHFRFPLPRPGSCRGRCVWMLARDIARCFAPVRRDVGEEEGRRHDPGRGERPAAYPAPVSGRGRGVWALPAPGGAGLEASSVLPAGLVQAAGAQQLRRLPWALSDGCSIASASRPATAALVSGPQSLTALRRGLGRGRGCLRPGARSGPVLLAH